MRRPSLSGALTAATLANAVIFVVGFYMTIFTRLGPDHLAPLSMPTKIAMAIPIVAALAPAVAWLAPWPVHTPRRRLVVILLPAIYLLFVLWTVVFEFIAYQA